MKPKIKFRRTSKMITAIFSGILILANCTSSEKPVEKEQPNNVSFAAFAGSASCGSCHKDVYEAHLKTEHHLTSMPASDSSILGSFETGKNSFAFDEANLIKMEKAADAFYQVYYKNNQPVHKARLDMVIGSGRKGQSYVGWNDSFLVQHPITFFSPAQQWSNSPGYPPAKVVFNRPITSRCLECHSTYVENKTASNKRESFDRNRIILGVECEKCHGPAAAHVNFQTKNPQATEAKFIVNPGKLPRERVMDLCSLCHGGRLSKTKPSFQFQAGDTLSNYFSLPQVPMNESAIDVHGNQSGLLAMSKCYQLSAMTCLSCHDVHKNESNQVAVFSQRCVSCHTDGHQKKCKMTTEIGVGIQQNCIDCHMPKQPSHAVAVYLQNASSPTPALMRTHYVKSYPEETKKFLQQQKGNKK